MLVEGVLCRVGVDTLLLFLKGDSVREAYVYPAAFFFSFFESVWWHSSALPFYLYTVTKRDLYFKSTHFFLFFSR